MNRILLALVLLMTCLPGMSANTTPSPASATSSVTSDQIDAMVSQIQADKSLSADEKTTLQNLAETAKNRLKDITDYDARITEYSNSVKKPLPDPKEIKLPDNNFDSQVKKELEGLSDEKLEIERIRAQNTLSKANFGLKDLESQQASDGSTLSQDAADTSAAQQTLADISTELDQLKNSDSKSLATQARMLFLRARAEANQKQLEMLKQRSISAPVRKQQLSVNLQNARAEVAKATRRLSVIEKTISDQDMDEAQQIQAAIEKAEADSADKPPIIREQIKRNASLSTQLSIMLTKNAKLNRAKERLQRLNQEIDSNFSTIQKRIQVAGLNAVLGEVLRKQSRKLEQLDLSDTSETHLQEEAEWAGIQQINIDTRRNELEEVPGIRQGRIDIPESANIPEEERDQVGTDLFLLMQTEKDLLDKLEDGANDYLRGLEETSFQEQQLTQAISNFQSFLDENLLWTPSAGRISQGDLPKLISATNWFISPDNWIEIVNDLYESAQTHLPRVSVALLLACILILARPYFTSKLRFYNDKVSKLYTDKFIYSIIALGYIVLMHIPVPALLFTASELLRTSPDAGTFSAAVSHGLRGVVLPWFILNLLYSLYRTKGFVEVHLQWPKDSTRVMRNQLFYLRVVLPALLFIVFTLNSQPVNDFNNTLGRLAFISMLLVTLFSLVRMLAPKSGALSPLYKEEPDATLTKLRWPMVILIGLIPLVIIGFAFEGYYMSALELDRLFIMTVRVLFLSIFVYSLAIRIMNLSNRRLALRKAREKREAAKAEKEAQANQLDGAEGSIVIPQEELDIPTINQQTRQILSTTMIVFVLLTLWAIWSDLFPALSVTDQFTLWQSSYTAEGSDAVVENITLANLLAALAYIILSAIIIKNLPGILELVFFQNMPSLDTGSRYAFTTLLRYGLTTVAILLVSSELGGHWEQVQFLVAALGVGLGFGLQEIFANMISGIIILFERPIRVGDTVTVGGLSGSVARIQMRATTLTDWDRKELIVPNKTFITEQLVNWTLTDAITRLVIPIGIAYGSDIQKAQEIFKKLIDQHPSVLKDPAPQVFFLNFGDSSLDFEIRVYVKDLGSRLPLQHDLLSQLNGALAEAGIEIPFPQRDLHVRSLPEALRQDSTQSNTSHEN